MPQSTQTSAHELGRDVRRIDPEYLNPVDCLKDLLDLRPPSNAQETLPARTYKRHGRVASAWLNRVQDVDTRHDGSVVVGCQRTNAKMLYAATETTRCCRSITCSSTTRPKRTQFSMRFLSHVSSTCVSSQA